MRQGYWIVEEERLITMAVDEILGKCLLQGGAILSTEILRLTISQKCRTDIALVLRATDIPKAMLSKAELIDSFLSAPQLPFSNNRSVVSGIPECMPESILATI